MHYSNQVGGDNWKGNQSSGHLVADFCDGSASIEVKGEEQDEDGYGASHSIETSRNSQTTVMKILTISKHERESKSFGTPSEINEAFSQCLYGTVATEKYPGPKSLTGNPCDD